MKASDTRDILQDFSVTPSKSMGQNFLVDENVARWIVEQLDIQPHDCVVEVGPGAGALTEHIAPLCRKLILVEYDARLADYQRQRWEQCPHVEVHQADGANWDPRPLFAERPVKFIGNLPYSAGGAILSNFLNSPCACTRAVVMLQKEFIDRILANAGDDAYGILSLRMQMDWVPKALKTIPPEAFSPRPRIDSTVMLLTPREETELPPYSHALMDQLMRRCFSQRRKQMHKQMPDHRDWKEIAAQVGIPVTARPEELSLRQWAELTAAYDTNPLAHIAQKPDELFDIVDDKDEVIGQGTRQHIHEQGLKHRAVHVIVFNKNRDCYLQKRSAWKDFNPSLWGSSCAGHLDAGESPEEAAQRELKEELGISDNIKLIPVTTLPPNEDNGQEFIYVFLAAYTGKVSYPAAEVSAVMPFNMDLIDRWIEHSPADFAPSFAECWQAVKSVF